jgi:isopropylmalate/homocitrate/citramalate synthase
VSRPWKTSRWFASPWNFAPESDSVSALPPRIRFHDVTLRDGEQQAGIVFSREERIAVARALADCGVDRIEAGMPAESAEDRDLVETLAGMGLSERLFPFAGCTPESARIARECGARGIVFKVTTSRHLLAHGYRQNLEDVIASAIEATLAAREAGLYTVLFTIDATRTPPREYLDTVERIVSRGHCDSVTIADSYGAAAPNGIAGAVRALRQRLKLAVEIHCHNDFGLAAGNTLAGLMAGARSRT